MGDKLRFRAGIAKTGPHYVIYIPKRLHPMLEEFLKKVNKRELIITIEEAPKY